MPSEKHQDVRVGVVAVVALAAVVGGIIWGKGCGFRIENRRVTIALPDAAGIDAGTTITIRGVKVGSVTSIQTGRDSVIVSALMSGDIPLYDDASAAVRMLELTGGRAIEIIPGVSSRPLAPEARIPGSVSDITALLRSADRLTTRATDVLVRLDSTVAYVNELAGNPNVRREIEGTVHDVAAMTATTRTMIESNRSTIDEALRNLAALSNQLHEIVRTTRPAVERTIRTADTLGADAHAMAIRIERSLNTADSLVARLNAIAHDIRHGNGAVSRLMFDTSTADQLMNTIEAVRALVSDIQANGVKANVKVDIF